MPQKKVYKKTKQMNPQKVNWIVKKQLARSSETKRFGVQQEEQSILSSSAGTVYNLSQIAQGDGASSRDGNKVDCFGLNIRYILHNNSAVPGYARVLIIATSEDNYTLNTDEWFAGSDGNGQAPIAERLRDVFISTNSFQNKILYDKTHRIAGLGDGTGVETVFKKQLIKRKLPMVYPSGTTEDSMDNNIRMLVLWRSADNDTTAQTIEFTYESMVYFKDL